MRRSVVVTLIIVFFSLGLAGPALADNPPGPPGPPGQSCQDLGLTTPGNAANSRGARSGPAGLGTRYTRDDLAWRAIPERQYGS